MSREDIRHARSRAAQGKRAGFASQVVAMVLDLVSVVVIYVGVLLVYGGVVVLGPVQLAATVPLHASQMFARNVLTLVQHLSTKEGALKIDPEDEITKAMLITLNGQVPGGGR